MSDLIVIDVIVDETFDFETTSSVVDVETPEPVLSVITVEGPEGPRGPAGAAGDGATVFGEHLTGANGTNLVFTTAQPYRPNTTAVYLNGLREFVGEAYTETTSTTITFTDPPLTGDSIRIDYTIQ